MSAVSILKRRADKLLFLLIRNDAGCREGDIRRLIKKGVDFEYLVRIAHEKGVSSLAYQALKDFPPSNDAEKKALHDLRVSYLITAAANNHYKEELTRILAAFGEKGIEVIPLKGITLTERLYGDITSRGRSIDLDLLVREKDKERARGLLEDAGYSFMPVDEKEEYKWYYAFHKRAQKMIELHWDITMMTRSPNRIEGLWRGTEKIMLDDIQYLDFKPEELLLYLSVHLVNSDSFRKLRYLCDINRLIEKYQGRIDWDLLVRKAKDWNMRGSLYTCLMLNNKLFGWKAPVYLARSMELSLPKRIFIRTFASEKVILKSNSFRRRFLDFFLSYVLLECFEADSAKEYLAILKRVFFPPKAGIKNGHYILRPVNALRRLFALRNKF